jgi:hypothetical protein
VLAPSVGTPTQILSVPAVTGDFNEFTGHGTLPATTNTDLPPVAYIDYKLLLPNNSNIYLTSFQLIVQDALDLTEPSFEQDSIERQVDHTFHYFKPKLEFKPIPSYTIGWDFPFNPGQELGPNIAATVASAANQARYIADQTIAFESVGNVLSYTLTSPGGLTVKTTANTQFALIQYLDGKTANELILSNICSQIKGYFNGVQGSIAGNITLWATTNTNLPTLPATFFSTLTNGVPTTIASQWFQIPRSQLGSASFTFLNSNQSIASQGNVYPFKGWNENGTISDSPTFFAIVVGFNTLNITGSGEGVVINHVSLQAGDIPTQPAPLSVSQTLAALQYYYETNYPLGAAASGASTNNLLVFPLANSIGINGGGAVTSYGTVANSFYIPWYSVKRATPNVAIISQVGTATDVSYTYIFNGSTVGPVNIGIGTYWSGIASTKGESFQVAQSTFITTLAANPNGNLSSWISLNYTADARLGVVN